MGQNFTFIHWIDDSILSLKNQIIIDSELIIKVFLGDNELSFSDLKWVLPLNMKLSRWSQLENLLSRYKISNHSNEYVENISLDFYLENGLKNLNKALDLACNDNEFLYTKNHLPPKRGNSILLNRFYFTSFRFQLVYVSMY